MNELIVELNKIKNCEVDIFTYHIFFGEQHIKAKFLPYVNNGIGFYFKDQKIYIKHDEFIGWSKKNNSININGKKMNIIIITS